MKLLIDLPKEVNKNLKIYKAEEELSNLGEAIIKILEEFFEDE